MAFRGEDFTGVGAGADRSLPRAEVPIARALGSTMCGEATEVGIEPHEVQCCFIVGMARAGTTWLAQRLQSHPQAAVLYESLYWGRGWEPPGRDGQYSRAQLQAIAADQTEKLEFVITEGTVRYSGLDAVGCGRVLEDALLGPGRPLSPAEAFRRLATALAVAEGARMVVEKTPHHLLWVDRILAAIPDARFVILVRDPHGFALSYKHQGDRQADDEVRSFFRVLYHPLVCAWLWRRSMRAALAAVERHPAQTLLVRLDALAEHSRQALRDVGRFLGLPEAELDPSSPPSNSSFPDGVRPTLSTADLYWLDLLCGHLAAAHGWGRVRPRFGLLAALASLLTLPVWFLRNGLPLRRMARSRGYYLSWLRR